jgi:hypothetical protein
LGAASEATLSEQGRFLCTSDLLLAQYRAMNVRQLREPSTAEESGNDAYVQFRSQKSMEYTKRMFFAENHFIERGEILQ